MPVASRRGTELRNCTRAGRRERSPQRPSFSSRHLHTKSANCTNVRVWFYCHRRRRSLSMRAGCLRPVPASGGRACLDILSHGRAPCASSRYGGKDLRKLPYPINKGNTRKFKWNTCIPLEYANELEYKYVYSTCIPVYSTYSSGIHCLPALCLEIGILEYDAE